MLKAKKTSPDDRPHLQEALDEVTKEATKRLNVDIPASLHQEIKTLAARQNTNIRDIVLACLHEYVSRNSNTH
jgi:predicted HicB family RNase H-like nuclease